MEYAKTHEEWNRALGIIADTWSRKDRRIDRDEAYSELLVAYAEALACPRKKNVKFDTIFHYYKLKAYRNLTYRDRRDQDHLDFMEDDILDTMSADFDMLKAIREIMFDLDSLKLDADTLAVLSHIRSDEFQEKEFRTIGERTIVNEMITCHGWGYRRAERAVRNLGEFYRGYVAA